MKNEERKYYSLGEKTILWCVFVFFAIYALTLLIPFVWAFLNSLKTNAEYFIDPFGLPKKAHFENYLSAFTELNVYGHNLVDMFINSIILTLGGTIVSTIVASMTAYVIAKYDFVGRKFLYNMAIFTFIIPIVGNLPATYKLVNDLGLMNNMGILVLYAGGFGFNFIILHSYFKSIPWSYAEAAFMDGASNFQVFRKVMLPLARGPITSIALISGIGIWNDYMTPFLYLDEKPTLSLGIYMFQEIMIYKSNYPLFFAAILISVLPILIIFIIFQKTIMENTVAGGLKG